MDGGPFKIPVRFEKRPTADPTSLTDESSPFIKIEGRIFWFVFVDIFQFHENPAENFQRPQFNH
jgi:hypothetical protein